MFRETTRSLTLATLCLFLGEAAFAQGTGAARTGKGGARSSKEEPATSKDSKRAEPRSRNESKVRNSPALARLKRQYRLGELNDRAMWGALSDLFDDGQKLSKSDRSDLLQTQANMLFDAGYPILAAVYATQALKVATNPVDGDMRRSWKIIDNVTKRRPIQNILEILAEDINLRGKEAPELGTDWYYYEGNAAAKAGKPEAALEAWSRLTVNDRYFFPAKYQQAMVYVEQDKLKTAETALRAILFPASQERSPLREKTRIEMSNFARMALARINYEQRDFAGAIRLYRAVTRDSGEFYDALFEQSWAFFMAGYPNHALGAIHSIESPFFAQVFNPEGQILKSIVYYWMCRYEDSRTALADFMEKHSGAVESLGTFLDRQQLGDDAGYQLFENLISGVSGESLGIPREVLVTAAEKDTMMHVRDQFAAVVEERAKLEAKGIFGTKKGVAKPMEYMDRWVATLRADIGKKFVAELRAMKSDYERLYDQAQFLYVELLMSEKEQILGKELHASNKISKVNMRQNVSGWGRKTQSWAADSEKNEFWWDEVGFYIYRVEPMCTTP
jgi:tetratricopeptide (TPR) repeat protein